MIWARERPTDRPTNRSNERCTIHASYAFFSNRNNCTVNVFPISIENIFVFLEAFISVVISNFVIIIFLLFLMLVFFTRFIMFDNSCNASHRFCLQFINVSLKIDEPVHLIAGQKYWKCKNIRWHMKFSLQAIRGRNVYFFYFLIFFPVFFSSSCFSLICFSTCAPWFDLKIWLF